MSLAPHLPPWLASIEHHVEIASTNDRAKQLAAEPNSQLPLLVVADRQTAGRGRGSRRWWSDEGSLTFTLAVDLPSWGVALESAGLIALAAGLAVVDAVKPLLPAHVVGLHWPNDVYVGQRKVAGILVEVVANRRAVIGIGVNLGTQLNTAPEEVRRRAVSLAELVGAPLSRIPILSELLEHLRRWTLAVGQSPSLVTTVATARCLQRGTPVVVRTGDGIVSGLCKGITATGELAVETREGPRAIASGVVDEAEQPSA